MFSEISLRKATSSAQCQMSYSRTVPEVLFNPPNLNAFLAINKYINNVASAFLNGGSLEELSKKRSVWMSDRC